MIKETIQNVYVHFPTIARITYAQIKILIKLMTTNSTLYAEDKDIFNLTQQGIIKLQVRFI